MFEGKNLIDLIAMGGFTMAFLIFCSIVALAIVLQRLWIYRKAKRVNRDGFISGLKTAWKENPERAVGLSRDGDFPLSRVVLKGLTSGPDLDDIREAMDRQIALELCDLQKHTSILGTIGGTVVYVGLFGTVLGIIRAFQGVSLASIGSGEMGAVVSGVAEALVCTAAGIAVAVPSVAAFNILMKRVEAFRLDMELAASEIVCLLRSRS